jgi:hypothetical protein
VGKVLAQARNSIEPMEFERCGRSPIMYQVESLFGIEFQFNGDADLLSNFPVDHSAHFAAWFRTTIV